MKEIDMKFKMLLLVAVTAILATLPGMALTNDLETIQGTTTMINSGFDTGFTIGLGLLGVLFGIGALRAGLISFSKRKPV